MKRVGIAMIFGLAALAYAHVPTALLGVMDPTSSSTVSPPLVAGAPAFLFALPIRRASPFTGSLIAFWAYVATLLYLAALGALQMGGGRSFDSVLVRFAWLFAGGAPPFGGAACLLGAMIGGVCQRVVPA